MDDRASDTPEIAIPGYERPKVERVLDPSELEREVLYAGDLSGPPA